MTLTFSRFWHANFWKMIIFHLHGQYAHQMKSEIILNSYLLSKSTILYEIFFKNWISNLFSSIFKGKRILIANFSKYFVYNPQLFFLRMISNTKMEITWRSDSTDAIQDVAASSQICFVHIPPPTPSPLPDLIRVKSFSIHQNLLFILYRKFY